MAIIRHVISFYDDASGHGEIGVYYNDASNRLNSFFAVVTGSLLPRIIVKDEATDTILVDEIAVQSTGVERTINSGGNLKSRVGTEWWRCLPDGMSFQVDWI